MKAFSRLATAVAAVAMCGAAQAATYSLTFQDVTFEIAGVDSDTFSLTILGADSPTGDWVGVDYLRAFAIKDIGTGITGGSATGNGGPWTTSLNELNGATCGGGASGGICFQGGNAAVAPSMSWTIDVTGGLLNFGVNGPHLKVGFDDTATRQSKDGSLLSLNLPPNEVPVPGTLGLLGLGLAGLGVIRRKK